MTLPWVLEQGRWRLDWDPKLALPELEGGRTLGFERDWSGRAAIYDLLGDPLASQIEAVSVGIWPDYVDRERIPQLASLLSAYSPYRLDVIANLIQNAPAGEYLPLGEAPADLDPERLALLKTYGSVVISEYSRRVYPDDGIAPHVVGYVGSIQPDETSSYRRRGYLANDQVGRQGIEGWGEQLLTGEIGGRLYVFNPDGQPAFELASAPSEPGQDIHLTIKAGFPA